MTWRQTARAGAHDAHSGVDAGRRPAARAPRSSSSGRLAAAIAHEIRTPLAVALMYMRLVEQEAGPQVKESLRAGLSLARDEVMRLDRLLGNLVDLHRLGHVVIRPALVDAGRVVSDAVRRTPWEAGAGRVAIEVGAADLLDWWDASALEQIVQNLLSNAVQHGEAGPVSVSVNRIEANLRLRIHDSGGGVSASERLRAFPPRLAAPKTRASGWGLGLWLVRELAEAHGGSASIESRRGEGSTFTVMLSPQRP
jgi:signal transduction histidine kinase